MTAIRVGRRSPSLVQEISSGQVLSKGKSGGPFLGRRSFSQLEEVGFTATFCNRSDSDDASVNLFTVETDEPFASRSRARFSFLELFA